jgi:6-phosphogluconate dehydrogenase (decarboxylating)
MRFWAVGFCGLGRIGIFMVDNIVDQVIECI